MDFVHASGFSLLALRCFNLERKIWSPTPMKVFSLIGFMYALGDYLEMASPLEAMFLTDLEAASFTAQIQEEEPARIPGFESDCSSAWPCPRCGPARRWKIKLHRRKQGVNQGPDLKQQF